MRRTFDMHGTTGDNWAGASENFNQILTRLIVVQVC